MNNERHLRRRLDSKEDSGKGPSQGTWPCLQFQNSHRKNPSSLAVCTTHSPGPTHKEWLQRQWIWNSCPELHTCNCGKHCPNIYAESIWSRSTGRRRAHSRLEADHTSDSAAPSLLYGPMSCRTQQVLHMLEREVAVRDASTMLLDFPVTTAWVKWSSIRHKLASAILLQWQKANEDKEPEHITPNSTT